MRYISISIIFEIVFFAIRSPIMTLKNSIKNFLILIMTTLLLTSCINADNQKNIHKKKMKHSKIEMSKELSFDQYVNILLENSLYKAYPNINNIPD